ncbi:MAG: RdgB/HAM1 family non-canonical purine NTP pyrophosphatase [Deltaproteobacteria bacterium]
MELLVATRNKKKLREIREILSGLPFRVTSLDDYADGPMGLPAIEEDGLTFEQNAIKKAATVAMFTGKLVLGEDSGLEVAALKNAPGVYSARYAGPGATDAKNNAKLLRALRGVPAGKRGARYRCAVALADGRPEAPFGQGLVGVVSGSCRGVIGVRPRGTSGFGYDPLFVIPRYGKTFAQLGPEIKHAMSHRFRALEKARRLMGPYLRKVRKRCSKRCR